MCVEIDRVCHLTVVIVVVGGWLVGGEGGGVDQRLAAGNAVLHAPRQPPLTISCATTVESA